MKYQKNVKGKIQCLICPRSCKLKEGQRGFCHVRQNIGGKIILTTYGFNTGLSIDPIEKKPLYHFFPESLILSFGTIGCNMGCLFCQNYKTTKVKIDPEKTFKCPPEKIVETARHYGLKSVAFTYNEPVIFFEYMLDTAKLCKKEGIKTVIVTSGFIEREPMRELYEYMDAANIDLKGFSEEFYGKNCMAKLAPVLDTIKYVKNETDCHLELTTLLIEGENTSDEMIKKETGWILENLGENVPLHFSAFSPKYKFASRKETNFKTLLNARKTALDAGLNYVYTGNLSTIETGTTFCKNCKKPLIVRSGYKIAENNLEGGKCKFCRTKLDGVF